MFLHILIYFYIRLYFILQPYILNIQIIFRLVYFYHGLIILCTLSLAVLFTCMAFCVTVFVPPHQEIID